MTLQEMNFTMIQRGGKERFKCLICGRRYKMLGPHLDQHYEEHRKNGQTVPVEPVQDRQQLVLTNEGVTEKKNLRTPLTQAEYDRIKELLFRGEDNEEVAKQTGRAMSTVIRVKSSSSLKDYMNTQRNKWNVWYAKTHNTEAEIIPNHVQPPIMPPVVTSTERIEKMRQQITAIIMEFVATEIKETQRDFVEQLEKKFSGM